MPGVNVLTDVISGPAAIVRAPGATWFVAGITERGPVDRAVKVRSMRDVTREFGPRVSYGALHDALEMYFAEGGGTAQVARVVGPAAVKALRALMDRAGVPVATLEISAIDPGAWGNALTVAVQDGTLANTYRLVISGTPDGEDETFDNLASPAAGVEALLGSRWVRGRDLGSATAAPNNNPAVIGPTALATGTDDRAAIVAQTYVDALARLTPDLGAGAVSIPGQSSVAVQTGLMAHAETHNRLALLATAAGLTPTAARAAAAALIDQPGAEFSGIFYPHVRTPAGGGATRLLSPEGYAAAKRAQAHLRLGPWRAAAGELAEATFVLGLEREIGRDEGDALDDAHVSAIRSISGGTRVYGWRSLSSDTDNWALLTGRDVLNDLIVAAEKRLETFLFEPIDGKGQLFGRVAATLTGLAEPMRAAGGLYEKHDDEGNMIDKGYRVDVGPGVNTEDSIALGEIRGLLAVRVSPTGTLVEVTIAKAAQTASL